MSDALLSAPPSTSSSFRPAVPPRRGHHSNGLLFLRLPRRADARSSLSASGRGSHRAACSPTAWGQVGEGLAKEDAPASIELVPIVSEQQFDRAIAEAQQLEEPLVVLWMANWCRKCIYLKPKLEKLAAEYYPRMRFYCVDVNTVPQRLVSRAEITKMPTIQLWKDSQKQAEVIGGHKAWLVIDDVRRMIEGED